MMNTISRIITVCSTFLCSYYFPVQGQSISEAEKSIKTYPFSDANPIPSMAVNKNISRFYPYFMFDGYSATSKPQSWKVVTLDNKYITVQVLPQVGGKVYGAIEKSTGYDFVYLNKVMKFRAIGSRGPWTSGGIEHNFGLDIGHAPWAAGAVDYIYRKKEDGTLECVVGGIDLASRTQWRVAISLPENSAYFETKALLFNPTPYHHAYLSWENAAYRATDDLEFFFPGNYHIDHDGSARPWPIDEQGRDLSKYKNNNFGTSKSYHVMGSTRNWFGGIWQNRGVGFGHWAPYTDAPGKKLWIWSLARDGAIWEDLLTDDDGQYIEAQSGVKFNQADVVSGYHSPFKQLYLRPGYSETKYETWFPVKDIGAIHDATTAGSLSVAREKEKLTISISPNVSLEDSLYVLVDNTIFHAAAIQLQPLKLFTQSLNIPSSSRDISVKTTRSKLQYSSTPELIDRPVVSPVDYSPTDAHRQFLLAEDKNSMRLHDEALSLYRVCLQKEPSHTSALTRIAELLYRKMEDDSALAYARKALSINTYDAAANYIYGIIEKRKGNINEAEEAFSVATRIIEFRSDAYRQLAELALASKEFEKAAELAVTALQYNSNNVAAHQLLCVALRISGKIADAEKSRRELLDIDPLNHFARFEHYLQVSNDDALRQFRAPITNEFPHETYLELAATYLAAGQINEGIRVLEIAPEHPMVYYWLGFSKKDKSIIARANELSSKFVFPHREESVPVLQYAITESDSWKPKYYLALVYWSKGATGKALELLQQCGNGADFAPLYISRGYLQNKDGAAREADFRKALQLEPREWRTYQFLAEHLSEKRDFAEAEKIWANALKIFPDQVIVNLGYAKALLDNKKFAKCLAVLKDVYVLPQEHANQGHNIYEQANIALALEKIEARKLNEAIRFLNDAKKWPEHLGSGEPYDPDNRLANILLAYCEAQKGNTAKASELKKSIVEYTVKTWPRAQKPLAAVIGLTELKAAGKPDKVQEMLSAWKTQTDSLTRWGLPGGTGGVLRDYLLARIENRPEADTLEKKIMSNEADLTNRLYLEAIRIVYP